MCDEGGKKSWGSDGSKRNRGTSGNVKNVREKWRGTKSELILMLPGGMYWYWWYVGCYLFDIMGFLYDIQVCIDIDGTWGVIYSIRWPVFVWYTGMYWYWWYLACYLFHTMACFCVIYRYVLSEWRSIRSVKINQYYITLATHYDITMGNDFARDAHCETTIGNDVARDIHCDVTINNDVAMCTYHGITMHDDVAVYSLLFA